jgi:MFS family permease
MHVHTSRNLKHNYIFNVLDGAFFGMAIGFASFSTVLPLFFSTMTSSAVLIGLIPAIHNMGWQLPQLFLAGRISRLERFKPLTLWMTINERLPFLGLATVALLLPKMNTSLALALSFLFLVWQGMGAGLAANPWQNLIGRIIPMDMRATFFGLQSAASNLLGSGGALAAGYILSRYSDTRGYAISFFIACGFFVISWFALAQTREEDRMLGGLEVPPVNIWKDMRAILRKNISFRWFLASRILTQFAGMATAFYTVYAVRYMNMDELTAGVLTSVLLITQTIANPLLGWMADRWSRKAVLTLGAVCTALSALLAYLAVDLALFYPVIVLMGIGNVAYWTIGLALSLDYGEEHERPVYVGMANTLIAPATILAPFLGGLLADSAGYRTTFIVAAVVGLFTAFMLVRFVRDPHRGH